MNARLRPIIVVFAAGVVAAAAIGAAALAGGDGDVAVQSNGTATPGRASSPLHEARLDLAGRADVDALAVRLVSIRHAGFDSCLGVIEPGPACREIFLAGYIAIFDAGGRDYRYHFGGGEFVGPVDPAKADNGVAVPPQSRSDLIGTLAGYARREHAARARLDWQAVTVLWIAPVRFDNACLAFRPYGSMCLEKGPLTDGALVQLSAAGGTMLYSVATSGGVVFHDPASGDSLSSQVAGPDPAEVDAQARMRADLAGRLGVGPLAVSVVSFRRVTWGNGCLGVEKTGVFCTEALVDGYLALLEARDRTYRYHGGNGALVATEFESGARIIEPAFE